VIFHELIRYYRIIFIGCLLIIIVACTPGGEFAPITSPTIVSAVSRDQSVILEWTLVEGAKRYHIYYSNNQSNIKNASVPIQTENPTVVVKELENDKPYYFAITALGDAGESEINRVVEKTPRASPLTPQNVSVSAGNESLTIAWLAEQNAQQYNVYIARSPNITRDTITTLTGWMIIKDAENPYTQTGLINGVTHYVVVSAEDERGESALSEEISAIPSISRGLSVGGSHACAILYDDSLWCWGRNSDGQLGDNSLANKYLPTPIVSDIHWKKVSLGSANGCAMDFDNVVWCWGRDLYANSLGLSGTNVIPVKFPLEKNWLDFEVESDVLCALNQEKRVNLECWGTSEGLPDFDKIGELELTTYEDQLFSNSYAMNLVSSCAIDSNKQLWCWGTNNDAELGYGIATEKVTSKELGPIPGEWLSVTVVRGYSSRDQGHACGIKKNNGLWCWGGNLYGQLGLGNTPLQSTPVEVTPGSKWHQIALGPLSSCGIQTNNTLWCWGSNEFGRIGLNTLENTLLPKQVGTSNKWRDVSAYGYNKCAAQFDGTIWCTGDNSYGQLGIGEWSSQVDPSKIMVDVKLIQGNSSQVCALNQDGKLFCWGGVLIDGSGKTSIYKRHTPQLISNENIYREFGISTFIGCGLTIAGSIQCWGNVGGGFDNPVTKFYTPIVVGEPGVWLNIAVANHNVCAIKEDNSLWCLEDFDYFDRSNTKNPDNVNVFSFKLIDDSQEWQTVFANTAFACAMDVEQDLWCWGDAETDITLGLTEELYTDIPYKIKPDVKWISVDIGGRHRCGISVNNKIWCWGSNIYSQLGNNIMRVSTIPVLLESDKNWISVSVGEFRTCAVEESHTLWCWGLSFPDLFGQDDSNKVKLIPNEIEGNPIPAQMGNAQDWKSVFTKSDYICATKLNDDLYCWGNNTNGRIGNGKAWSDSWQQVDFSNTNIMLN